MKKILLSVFVLSILLPTLAFASFDTSLKYGSRGDAVLELQDLLVAQGFLKTKADGRFGLVTLNAVKAFQSANGLSSDGYFGKASRAKASSILAEQLQSSNTAEQADTGTVAITSTVAGCTSTSLYSPTTGQPCNSTTQPTTPNLPAGCTSTSGFSITTGQACNGIASTIQQLQQTVQQQAQTIQQIQQNTQQIVQNTQPAPVVVPTPVAPISITVNQPVCTTTSTSQWSINTDWSRVSSVIVRFTGTTTDTNLVNGTRQTENLNKSGLTLTKNVDKGTDPTSYSSPYLWHANSVGTLSYTAYVFSLDKPYVSALIGQDPETPFADAVASSTGNMVLPDCTNYQK